MATIGHKKKSRLFPGLLNIDLKSFINQYTKIYLIVFFLLLFKLNYLKLCFFQEKILFGCLVIKIKDSILQIKINIKKYHRQ